MWSGGMSNESWNVKDLDELVRVQFEVQYQNLTQGTEEYDGNLIQHKLVLWQRIKLVNFEISARDITAL
jgi:hypothetical protein